MPNPYGQWVPDPLAASGFRWQRTGEQPPTQIQPAVPPRTVRYDEHEDHQLPQLRLEQDDLSDRDETAGEIVNTPKLGPLDEVLIQPSQDPGWRP